MRPRASSVLALRARGAIEQRHGRLRWDLRCCAGAAAAQAWARTMPASRSSGWIWTTSPPGSGCPSRMSTVCTGSPATSRRLRCPPGPARPRSSTGSRCGQTTPPRSWRAGPTQVLNCGLRSCAGCSTALVRADLGGHSWLSPGPELPRDRGPAWRHLYVYAYLALAGVVTGYHRDHGIAEAVSWVTLADLGRNLAIDRRMHREGWPVMQSWLTLHARGGVYELGRLSHPYPRPSFRLQGWCSFVVSRAAPSRFPVMLRCPSGCWWTGRGSVISPMKASPRPARKARNRQSPGRASTSLPA
jgi:hypothetical protein